MKKFSPRSQGISSPTISINKVFLVGLSFFFLSGCATLKIHHYEQAAQRPQEARTFYDSLDTAVKAGRVLDASGLPVRGFPYLRANRFLVALKTGLVTEEQRQSWVEQMRALDISSRTKEILNLSESSVKKLSDEFGLGASRQELIDLLHQHSETMLEHDLSNDRFLQTLDLSVTDPGEYSLAMRTAGLYPLFTGPTLLGTNILYKEFLQWHQTDLAELDILGSIVHYAPPAKPGISQETVQAMFQQAPKDPFGFPVLEQQHIDTLFHFFAPVLSQDQTGDYDKPGTIVWKDGKVTVQTQQPAVYTHVSHAFIDNQPAVQLNYSLWYEGRRGPHAPWLERGPLDGLTLRITLAPNGDPVLLDLMNNCGCYFMFFPGKKKIDRPVLRTSGTKLLVPSWLPEDFPKKSLHARVNSGWHQVQKIFTSDLPAEKQSYQLLPYETLEVLPHEDGRIESVFDHHGIMKDSWRIEPLVFFPAGIPKVGFMRQRGNHPIKLIGRAHFTDPYLFDKNFLYKK